MSAKDSFKFASQNKLRFPGPDGELTTKGLWDLDEGQLITMSAVLQRQHERIMTDRNHHIFLGNDATYLKSLHRQVIVREVIRILHTERVDRLVTEMFDTEEADHG